MDIFDTLFCGVVENLIFKLLYLVTDAFEHHKIVVDDKIDQRKEQVLALLFSDTRVRLLKALFDHIEAVGAAANPGTGVLALSTNEIW